MKPVDRQRKGTIALLFALGIIGACRNDAPLVSSAVSPLAAAPTTGPSSVDITWMSVSNIYYQLGSLNILTDGYFTRLAHSEFSGGGGGLAHTQHALTPDVPAVLRVRDALGGASAVNLLLTGHSHFDHAFDTATWASSTSATIYGSKTTCYQVVAQNIPAARCTSIDGGERITLADGVTMRVVRWNHSGDSSTNPEQHNPVELTAAPSLDPVTGGLYAGVADAFPNGGGSRGFLFTVDGPEGRISWFFQNSASTADLTVPIVVGGVDFGAPLDNLKAAMSDAGLTSVDLWIGTGGKPVAQLVVPVLKPKAYLPVHWDDMWSAFLAGVPAAFADRSLEDFLSQSGVNLVRPRQYMDKWRLDRSGIAAIDNGPVKAALGFCTLATSCGAGKNCGTILNGCGGTVSCGAACAAPETCGGGGSPNVCGCTPVTSCGAGKNCGTILNGCGGTVSCGAACAAPETCGGGGSANVCGCTPVTSCGAEKNCGTIQNGCGGTVSCGAACTAPETCGGGGSANVCGCTPVTSCGAEMSCGTIPNGCGGTVSCGAACTDAGPDTGASAAAGGSAGTAGSGGAGGATGGAGGDAGEAGAATGGAGGDGGGAGSATEIDGAAGVSADHDAAGDASGTSVRDGSIGDRKATGADRDADRVSPSRPPSGGGCGCRASGPAGPEPLLLVAILGLIARRARRPPRRRVGPPPAPP